MRRKGVRGEQMMKTYCGEVKMSGAVVAGLLAITLACGQSREQTAPGLSGNVHIDGSSTVFPITEAVAEEFQKSEPGVRVTVGIAGTGGGFKRFTAGETDINDASRPIVAAETEQAAQNGVQYIELPVAYDGLSVVVHPANDFVDFLTVEELKRIWEPGSAVRRWSDVRKEWPNREIHLYGAGTDSGTFDYFTEVIVGKAKAIRPDFNASEDDNVLVQGTAGDRDSLAFFGYAYYHENRQKLKVVPIDAGQGPVAPSPETILNGSYQPLSRPVFIYVSAKAAERPAVNAFVRFYLQHVKMLAGEVGYVALPDSIYELARTRFESRYTGSVFGGQGARVGVSLETLLTMEQ